MKKKNYVIPLTEQASVKFNSVILTSPTPPSTPSTPGNPAPRPRGGQLW